MDTKKYLYMFNEGGRDQKKLLGGKGAALCEMTRLGLPVPYGFILSTEACVEFMKNSNGELSEKLKNDLKIGIKKMEIVIKKEFNSESPLIVSVRSGAPVSMPGMMDTVLNVGLNDNTVVYLAKKHSNYEFAYEAYSRLIEMFSNIVMQINRELFVEKALFFEKKMKIRNVDFYKTLVKEYKKIYFDETGEEFPQEPKTQLEMCVKSIFKSWNNDRAKLYREINGIDNNMGTAVNIQEMVFGNLNDNSATGVAFSRNPATGENNIFGEYLIRAQGEDIVAGIRTPYPIENLQIKMPKIYEEFIGYVKRLENYYKDMQDIEFTIENGKLYILQTRNGKRSPIASIKIAVDMVNEKITTEEDMLLKIESKYLSQVLNGNFDKEELKNAIKLGKGLAGSAGVAVGKAVLSSDKVVDKETILVRNETSPEDLRGMSIASGILTAKGGLTSHGAVVARGMGKCCVAGCSEIKINLQERYFEIGNKIVKEGEYISIDGYTGEIYLGQIKINESSIDENFEKIMQWSKKHKRLGVRINADTPEDCITGLRFMAEGIGLCRTEHMFFKEDRIWDMREMIMADTLEERKNALEKIYKLQKKDFYEMMKIMNGLPLNIRLLDPPLHEFLPQNEKDMVKMSEILNQPLKTIVTRIKQLEEHNPMLGHRGCRLAITYPEIYQMQVKAIIMAALDIKEEGLHVALEIMIPLVLSKKELVTVKNKILEAIDEILINGEKINYKIGSMIELPRACVVANEIAQETEFFSFGTNDLTQTALGLSRDDSGKFIEEYKKQKIFENNPFETIDTEGVGELMKLAVKNGREVKPELKIGICGEHGGEGKSIEFCDKIGLSYVSCSPYRVPVALLSAAQSAIKIKREK